MIKKGLFWDFIGKLFNQGITIIVSIFLARLLLPEDFALIAIVLAIIGIASVFIDFGLTQALIQKQNVRNIHYNSIFWINISLAVILSILCFLSAPLISNFYKLPELINLIRVVSFAFILNALGGVHSAMLVKKMAFIHLSKINIISSFISGVIGVSFAFLDYGVWSLVMQYYSAAIIRQILLWNQTKWLPKFQFSWVVIRPLWHFSKNLFISSILNDIFIRIDIFIIGKLFSPASLGFYSRGKSLNQLISTYSSSSLTTVLFPALSKIQDNLEMVKKKVIDFFQLAALISFFLGGLLYITAQDIIVLMFTDKWMETVPYFQIMVLTTFAHPLSAIILTPLTSLGRSDVFLKLEIMKKILFTFTYVFGFSYGIKGFLYAMLFSQIIGVSLNGYYSGKIINWGLKEQWFIMFTNALISIVGASILFFFLSNEMINSHVLHLILCILSYTFYYIFVNYVFKTKSFQLVNRIFMPKILQILKKK